MEKLDYHKLKLVYRDDLCRLYFLGEKLHTKKPIIYINGQMEHRIQHLEMITNITKKSCYQYSWYYEYDDIYEPYIFVYDYPNINIAKITTTIFSKRLIEILNILKLENVDIIGESIGGIIAMQTSISQKVDKIIAIHSPILGTPLVDFDLLHKYANTRDRKIIENFIKFMINPHYGFQIQNKLGYPNLEKHLNQDKITYVGSSINQHKNNTKLEELLCNYITDMSNMPNDSIVCYDKKILSNLGYNVYEDEEPISHFKISNNINYTNNLYKKILKKQ